MANASPTSSTFVELSAHTVSVAIVSGRKVTALRSFSLDAKNDIAAFVAEHQIAGVTRASLLGAKNFLHPSTDEETTSVREPAALLAHLAKLPHGLEGSPFSVVVDAGTGLLPVPANPSPWIATAVEAAEIDAAKTRLTELGLAPAAITLSAPVQFGVVAASLAPGSTALVLLPGENDAHLAWVGSDGTQALAVVPVGYSQIFDAVQQGLGLKFKTAAGKLFYNENYDFSDAAPKVAAALAPAIQSFLNDAPATHLHIAGSIPAQAWLVNQLADVLKLAPWSPAGTQLAARLNLDVGDVAITASSAGLLPLASAGSADAPWVQSPLATQVAKLKSPAAPAAPAPAKPAIAVVAPAKPAAKPAAPAPVVIESVKPQPPAKAPAAPPKANPVPQPKPAAPAPRAARSPGKNKTGQVIIASTVVVVACIVGLAAFFKKTNARPRTDRQTEASAPAPAAPSATAVAAAPQSPPPSPPAGVPSSVSRDQFPADTRKFGNDRYRFEVTDKGFIRNFSTNGGEVLVESAAGISLQGSYTDTDGRRRVFNVGGINEAGYVATVKKSVDAGITVFDVNVTHPRFQLSQTFRCLADSVKITAKLTPVNLADPRGKVTAIHSVRLSPFALDPAQRMQTASDRFTYTMKTGKLVVAFDDTAWSPAGANARQTIIAGQNGLEFHFTESDRNTLTYELGLP